MGDGKRERDEGMSRYVDRAVDMPPGLERLVCRVLESRRGEENAIRRDALLDCAQRQPGFEEVTDRQIRAAIEKLRNQGVLIGNLSDGGGYYLVESREEYKAFRAMYGSRAFTILNTLEVMDHEAEIRWGLPAEQPSLFGT
jgi:hypothetical protein